MIQVSYADTSVIIYIICSWKNLCITWKIYWQ